MIVRFLYIGRIVNHHYLHVLLLMLEVVVVRFVDIDGTVSHHCVLFFFSYRIIKGTLILIRTLISHLTLRSFNSVCWREAQ